MSKASVKSYYYNSKDAEGADASDSLLAHDYEAGRRISVVNENAEVEDNPFESSSEQEARDWGYDWVREPILASPCYLNFPSRSPSLLVWRKYICHNYCASLFKAAAPVSAKSVIGNFLGEFVLLVPTEESLVSTRVQSVALYETHYVYRFYGRVNLSNMWC